MPKLLFANAKLSTNLLTGGGKNKLGLGDIYVNNVKFDIFTSGNSRFDNGPPHQGPML
jgi:hypothetical protein